MTVRDSLCCSSVLDLDEPNLSQYSGCLFEDCKDSSKENSGSMLNVVIPVSDERSPNCSCILPKGDRYLSLVMFSFPSSQHFLIGILSDLLIIFAPSLIDSSCRLILSGLAPNSTSSASLPLVAYVSRHSDRAFLCFSSNNLASAICKTGQAYSRMGHIKHLYSYINLTVLISSTCLICLNSPIALLSFCSVFLIWF